MGKKFNPKEFRNKQRIEVAIPGNPRISKIWVWDMDRLEYRPPVRGKAYVAEKTVIENFKVSEQRKSFDTLEEARAWRYTSEKDVEEQPRSNKPDFYSVYKDYEKNRLPQLRQSTQGSYKRMISKYFQPLMKLKMDEITPTIVDQWINHLKSLDRRNTRRCFTHELNLLSGIIRYYCLFDDFYESPIRERHRQLIKLNNVSAIKSKDLTEPEFFKFRSELEKYDDSLIFVTLATVQFYQALRISEAAALRWEDIKWNNHEVEKSRIRVSRSLFFPRVKGERPVIQDSFKNGKQNGGIKEAPIMRESAIYLKALSAEQTDKSGFIFSINGELLTYRQIQHAYDTAFKNAGLPYSGTHIMRHGGARRVYNKSNGDLAIVQQLLGNADYKSVLVYAKRSSSALNEFSELDWKSSEVSGDSKEISPTNSHKSEN